MPTMRTPSHHGCFSAAEVPPAGLPRRYRERDRGARAAVGRYLPIVASAQIIAPIAGTNPAGVASNKPPAPPHAQRAAPASIGGRTTYSQCQVERYLPPEGPRVILRAAIHLPLRCPSRQTSFLAACEFGRALH